MKYISLKPLAILASLGLAASLSSAGTMQHEHQHEMPIQSAIGVAGKASKVTRTVEVAMGDNMRFAPDTFVVKAGETIRFVVKNTGKIKHEFNIGTISSLKEHSEVMLKHSDMQHTEANVASLSPGKTGEVIWQFTKPGDVTFACLQPGHMSSGMKGVIKVTAAR